MEVAPQFIVHETAHRILNHHMSSALPGYLMLGSRTHVNSLAELPDGALAELAGLLADVWRELGESPAPPPIQGPSIDQVIDLFRRSFR
ncbi:MAG TPA: hypothetical protein DIW52_15915 [Pseudomonas sp.]|jgi:diadenosine tetraphosphate (Ap4A) HIT family hydrolase|nr:hypothetical protein [Pseudomonas sp.]